MAKAIQAIKMIGVAAGDAAAAIDVREDSDIVAIAGTMTALDLDTEADFCRAELSFLSTNQMSTNDARGSLLQLELQGTVETLVGVMVPQTAIAVDLGDGIPVNAGERVYIHISTSTGVTPRAIFMLYMAQKAVTRRRGRLR